MVATGVGLAPFVPMLERLHARSPTTDTWPIRGNRYVADRVGRRELEGLAASWPSFHFVPVLSRPPRRRELDRGRGPCPRRSAGPLPGPRSRRRVPLRGQPDGERDAGLGDRTALRQRARLRRPLGRACGIGLRRLHRSREVLCELPRAERLIGFLRSRRIEPFVGRARSQTLSSPFTHPDRSFPAQGIASRGLEWSRYESPLTIPPAVEMDSLRRHCSTPACSGVPKPGFAEEFRCGERDLNPRTPTRPDPESGAFDQAGRSPRRGEWCTAYENSRARTHAHVRRRWRAEAGLSPRLECPSPRRPWPVHGRSIAAP